MSVLALKRELLDNPQQASHMFCKVFINTLKDAFAKGEIVLGTREEGYEITSGFTERQPPQGYGFEVITPGRKYEFSAGSEEERDQWVNVLKDVISVPLTDVERVGTHIPTVLTMFSNTCCSSMLTPALSLYLAVSVNEDIARQRIQSRSLPRKLSMKAHFT